MRKVTIPASVLVSIACSACIIGRPSSDITYSTTLLKRDLVTDKTDANIVSYYRALARCRALESAADNGAKRARAASKWIAGVQAAIGGVSVGLSAFGANSGREASKAASESDTGKAESEGDKSRNLSAVGAAFAGIAAAWVLIEQWAGAAKQGANFKDAAVKIRASIKEAKKHAFLFETHMYATTPEVTKALAALSSAMAELDKCQGHVQDISLGMDQVHIIVKKEVLAVKKNIVTLKGARFLAMLEKRVTKDRGKIVQELSEFKALKAGVPVDTARLKKLTDSLSIVEAKLTGTKRILRLWNEVDLAELPKVIEGAGYLTKEEKQALFSYVRQMKALLQLK